MKDIKICSFNVKGINEVRKRRDIFDWLKKKNYDICLLQETHSVNDTIKIWESEWDYKCFFSCFTSNSRGTAILFRNSFQFTLHKEICDSQGRYIILDITINDVRLTLVNLYGPNKDEPIFFKVLKTKLEEFKNSKIVIGGYFNVVQNYHLDTSNLQNRNNPKSHEILCNIKNDLDLTDRWRTKNPNTRIYTWHNNRQQQSRLDYFLVSDEALYMIEASQVCPGYRSDHSIVQMTLKLTEQTKGPGLWKFNNSLLKDTSFYFIYIFCINETTHKYHNHNQSLIIDKQLFFEMLKMEIRGKTIAYTSAKKKKDNQYEKQLDKEINNLYEMYTLNPNDENLKNLYTAQMNLEAFRENKIEGIIT